MRTLFSTRRRLIIAAAIILFAATVGFFVFTSPASGPLTVHYTGLEPRHGNAVGFCVTNTTHQPVYLVRIRVETNQDSSWSLFFENQPPVFSGTNAAPASRSRMILNPGEHRTIIVTQPTNSAWRAGLVYTHESKGFRTWITRGRLALATRDASLLRVNVWAPYRTSLSEIITNAPPKP